MYDQTSGNIQCSKFITDYAIFNRSLANSVWKFNFEIVSLKSFSNISVAVRDRDNTINNNPSVDELKNEM